MHRILRNIADFDADTWVLMLQKGFNAVRESARIVYRSEGILSLIRV